MRRNQDDPEYVTLRDMAKAGYCRSGVRRWYESMGWDFRELVRSGTHIRDFDQVSSDPLVVKLLQIKRGG